MWLPLIRRTRALNVAANDGVGDLADPGPGGIDQNARGRGLAAAAAVEHQFPFVAPLDPHAAGAGADGGAALGGIERVQHDQPAVIDPAIGIFEGVAERALERLTDDVDG